MSPYFLNLCIHFISYLGTRFATTSKSLNDILREILIVDDLLKQCCIICQPSNHPVTLLVLCQRLQTYRAARRCTISSFCIIVMCVRVPYGGGIFEVRSN